MIIWIARPHPACNMQATMSAAPLIFFILLLAQSLQPGGPKLQLQWTLYGAPSEQKAREWAQTQFAQQRLPAKYEIKELRVAQIQGNLHTLNGEEPMQWTSFVSPPPGVATENNPRPEAELHDTYSIMPPNKVKKLPAAEMAAPELYDLLQKQNKAAVRQNWDDAKARYYIVSTRTQAVLIQAVNPLVAAVLYPRIVQGTPAGDESASVFPWHGVKIYSEDNPPSSGLR